MNNKLFLTLLSVFLSLTYSHAQLSKTIDVSTPGTLSVSLGDDKTKVTDLVITGTINDADFTTIKQMSVLKVLDMSGVEIVNATIPASAFAGRNMDEIILPEGLKTINERCFINANLTKTLVLPSTVESISNQVFENFKSGLDLSKTKTSLKILGSSVFSGIKHIPEFDFSDYLLLHTYSNNVFTGYSGHVILPSNLTTLSGYMFSGYTGSVDLPEGLKTINERCFINANLTKTLVLPSTVESIGSLAFQNNKMKVLVSLNPTPPALGANVFTGVDKVACTLYVPTGSVELYQAAAQWKDFLIEEYKVSLIDNLVFLKSTEENLYQVKTGEKFTVDVYANFMYEVRLGLFNASNGTFIEDIVSSKSNNRYTCEVSTNLLSGSYLIQAYILEKGEVKSISRKAGSHIIDRLLVTVKNNWAGSPFTGVTAELNNHLQISTGQEDLLEIATNKSFKVLVRYATSLATDIKIGLFDPTTGLLVSDVTKSVEGNIFTCKVPTALADAKYNLIPYQVIDGNNVYVDRLTDKSFLVDRLPLFVTLGDDIEEPEVIIPEKINLYYTEDSGKTVLAEYQGVRIGEYYWMNTPFMGNHIALKEPGQTGDYAYLPVWRNDYVNKISMTVENVNLVHSRLLMFENARLESDRKSYFDQILPGASNEEKMVEFEKYYGTYMSRGHIQWMYDARPWVKLLVEGDNKEAKGWDLPMDYDIRQLLAMCGNATMHEVRQYLSWGNDQKDAPSVVKVNPENYFDWFYHNPANFRGDSNGFDADNTNKYGFSMFPSGSKFHNPDSYRPLTQADAEEFVISKGGIYPYKAKRGDFSGLNQTFALSLHGLQSFILHDYPEIRSEKSYHWSPIRWCRQMTDEELGYKLYINQANFTDSRGALLTLKSKIGNGETIIIEKLLVGQLPGEGFVELPRGYLRGFYVQYILGKSTPEKTIPQIVDIALQNIYIWGTNAVSASESVSTRTAQVADIIVSDLKVYPNPVTDILYLESGASISEVQVYSTNGKMVLKQSNVGSSINVGHLASGTYVLKLQIGDKSYTHKMIKK